MSKEFGELSRDEQIELFTAWVDGATIEYLSIAGNWITIPNPPWHENSAYRIEPTKPSIDWDHVSPEYNWLASDNDGRSWIYSSKPDNSNVLMWSAKGARCNATAFKSFTPGTCDWEDSLVQRPEAQS